MSTKTKPKFKVGDYICNDETLFLEIVAVIEQPGHETVYGYINVRTSTVQWETAYEIDAGKYTVKQPDFAAYAKLAVGDVLKVGSDTKYKQAYVTVLARVGDAVLVSSAPQTEQVEAVTKIADQLKELTDGEFDLMDGEAGEKLRRRGSLRHQSKVADKWMDIRSLCLHNWPIVSEE